MTDASKSDQWYLERRHMTVFECDLVNSTSLAHKLDPEIFKDLILSYQDCVLEWVRRFDGFFVQFAGDAVWVYFGYPYAHEDDVDRAIRAALGIAQSIHTLNTYGESLNVRIGIATGICVVGNMRQAAFGQIHKSTEQRMGLQLTAFGDPPNLAARLQSLAKPGQIIVANESRSLVGDLYDFEDLGEHNLKGFKAPVKAWRVIGDSGERSRFRALRHLSLSPMVDRNSEREKLRELWKKVRNGYAQVAYMHGEPGIGKSRLAALVSEEIVGINEQCWWFHCSEHLQGSAFAPVIDHIQDLADFKNEDEDDLLLKKLKSLFLHLNNDELNILSTLFSIKLSLTTQSLDMSPARRRERLLEILVGYIQKACSDRPLLLVVEDFHWVDPSTAELLTRLISQSLDISLFILITSRKAPSDILSNSGNVPIHKLNISQLEKEDSLELLKCLNNGETLPDNTINEIVNQTDGVPLFIEDVTLSLLQSMNESSVTGEINSEVETLKIPNELHDHLMSRVDRLGDAKWVLQAGAVIGREFTFSSIKALSSIAEDELELHCKKARDSGLVSLTRDIPETTYSFKHAMVRDVAYENLLHAEKAELHGRTAWWLLEEHPELRNSQPETLAFHFEKAKDYEQAVTYWLEAGRKSTGRAGYNEAITHLKNAMGLLNHLQDSENRDRLELEIITELGAAHAGAGGFSGENTGKSYERARQLCMALSYPPETFPVLSGAGSFSIMRAEYEKACEIAKQAMELARSRNNSLGSLIGNRILGAEKFVTGHFGQAIRYLEDAIFIYDKNPELYSGRSMAFALDHKTTAQCYLALARLAHGQVDSSLRDIVQSLEHSRNLDRHSINYALCYQSALRLLREDRPEVMLDVASQSRDLALEEGYATWIGISRLVRGYATIELGKQSEGLDEIKQGVDDHAKVQAITFLPFARSVLAKGFLAVSRPLEAIEILSEAIYETETTGQLWYMPELQRLYAEALIQSNSHKNAITHYQYALDSADEIQAYFWKLKVLCSIIRNEFHVRHFENACELLSELYKVMEGGLETKVIAEAKLYLENIEVEVK